MENQIDRENSAGQVVPIPQTLSYIANISQAMSLQYFLHDEKITILGADSNLCYTLVCSS